MASSTEEVSAGAGNAEDRTPADDITSSENQFAVFKDFDFLEYELESQGVRLLSTITQSLLSVFGSSNKMME